MNDCQVCLGNDTKIEDKVQRYPKATQPRGSMLSSAQLMYGRKGSLTAQLVQSAHSTASQHSVAMQPGLLSSKKGKDIQKDTDC